MSKLVSSLILTFFGAEYVFGSSLQITSHKLVRGTAVVTVVKPNYQKKIVPFTKTLIQNNSDIKSKKFRWRWIGFFLGLCFSPLGVLVALLFKDKNLLITSLIGMLVALICLLATSYFFVILFLNLAK